MEKLKEWFKEDWNSITFLRGYFVGSSIGYLILFLYLFLA